MSSILIAENDRDARGLVAGWLGDAGHRCATADTADALRTARAHPPDALLVTVTSVEDGGMWILRTLAGQDSPVGAIALTPNPSLDVADHARRAGAVDCLPWPSSRAAVLDSVQRALQWRTNSAEAVSRQTRLREQVAVGRDRLMTTLRRVTPDSAESVLLATLESRGGDWHDHARRVARSSAALAAWLRLDDAVARSIRVAALLHDVGKLAVPEALLHSTAPLADDDVTVLRMHVTMARDLLGSVATLAPAAAFVGSARERFDGLGYPEGLAGAAIPLGARIIAVADAYDTMTSARGYLDPQTHEEANAELVRRAGTHFDPDVVRAWIEMGDHARCC